MTDQETRVASLINAKLVMVGYSPRSTIVSFGLNMIKAKVEFETGLFASVSIPGSDSDSVHDVAFQIVDSICEIERQFR